MRACNIAKHVQGYGSLIPKPPVFAYVDMEAEELGDLVTGRDLGRQKIESRHMGAVSDCNNSCFTSTHPWYS